MTYILFVFSKLFVYIYTKYKHFYNLHRSTFHTLCILGGKRFMYSIFYNLLEVHLCIKVINTKIKKVNKLQCFNPDFIKWTLTSLFLFLFIKSHIWFDLALTLTLLSGSVRHEARMWRGWLWCLHRHGVQVRSRTPGDQVRGLFSWPKHSLILGNILNTHFKKFIWYVHTTWKILHVWLFTCYIWQSTFLF